MLLFTGCATHNAGEQADPVLSASALESVGHVVWVDTAEETAVIRLERGASISGRTLTARNRADIETARLQPSGARQGNTLGARIVEGLPNQGDEVVATRDD